MLAAIGIAVLHMARTVRVGASLIGRFACHGYSLLGVGFSVYSLNLQGDVTFFDQRLQVQLSNTLG
jgi:hypothetical protein